MEGAGGSPWEVLRPCATTATAAAVQTTSSIQLCRLESEPWNSCEAYSPETALFVACITIAMRTLSNAFPNSQVKTIVATTTSRRSDQCWSPWRSSGRCQSDQITPRTRLAARAERSRSRRGRAYPRHPGSSQAPPNIGTQRMISAVGRMFVQRPRSAVLGVSAPSARLSPVAAAVSATGTRMAAAHQRGATRHFRIERKSAPTPARPWVRASTVTAARKGPQPSRGGPDPVASTAMEGAHEKANASTKNATSGCLRMSEAIRRRPRPRTRASPRLSSTRLGVVRSEVVMLRASRVRRRGRASATGRRLSSPRLARRRCRGAWREASAARPRRRRGRRCRPE